VKRLQVASALLLALVLGQPLGRYALAQRPHPPDSTKTDSLPRRNNAEGLMLPFMAAFAGVLALAPPTLLLTRLYPDTSMGAVSSAHIAVYAMAGGMGEESPRNLTHSENLELFTHNITAAVRIESFSAFGGARFATVRAGYLFHTQNQARGGITLGYRHASGPGTESAVEIGLPFVIGNQRGAMWLVPTYLISHQGVMWNYRFQGEFYTLPKPFFAGMVVEAKSLRQNGKGFGSVTLLIGVRR